MKRWFLSILLTLACTWTWAQNTNEPFKGHLYNKEYKVYLHINFYQNNILIPGQELFGQVAGYFGADLDSRKWIFTNVTLKDNHTAALLVTNDYGSEDLEATLTAQPDGTFVFEQGKGSTINFAIHGNGKRCRAGSSSSNNNAPFKHHSTKKHQQTLWNK